MALDLSFQNEFLSPFSRPRANGMGMGLANGGRISASANPNHGTTFSSTLPDPSSAALSEASAPEHPIAR
jgi:signal transduction histidine kinase